MGLESEGKGSSAALSNGPDPRFYETQAPAGLKELARLTDATVLGGHDPERFVRRVAGLENADSESVTFLSDIRYASKLGLTAGAGACFVGTAEATKGAEGAVSCSLRRSHRRPMRIAAERLHRPRLHPPGSASVHPRCGLGGRES